MTWAVGSGSSLQATVTAPPPVMGAPPMVYPAFGRIETKYRFPSGRVMLAAFVWSPFTTTGAWLLWKEKAREFGSDVPGVTGCVVSSSISQR